VLTMASENWNANHIRLLVNESATKANIRDAILWMANNANTEDTCLFFFSGHGEQSIDDNGDELDGLDESLRTYYNETILDDELEEWIGEVKAQKVAAILDACYTGGVLTPFQIEEVHEPDGFARDLEKANCVVFASGRINEVGQVFYDLKNGLFTYYVVQGLWGAADKDGDDKISVRELYDYTYPRIVKRLDIYESHYPQHPLLWPEDNIANKLYLVKLKTHIPKQIRVPMEYRTVQGAVEAAMPGDTIEVPTGTYNENLIINKPLTINAPSGKAIIQSVDTSLPCIIITADNVSISGLNCQGGLFGIEHSKSNNSTLTNNIVSNNVHGIYLIDSSQNIISNNNAFLNEGCGIFLNNCSTHNKIIGNNASNNSQNGIHLECSSSNIIDGNNATNNGDIGILLLDSGNTTLSNNLMTGNLYNFGVEGDSTSDFYNDVDISNLVDGKPIYYLVDAFGDVIDSSSNPGTVYCINCDSITIKDLTFTNNLAGIVFTNTSNSKIQNNYLSTNQAGIVLYESGSNTITGNNARNNSYYGIHLQYSGNNTLRNNLMTGNLYNFGVEGDSTSDFYNDADISNLVDGKPIYYLNGASGIVINSSSNAGTVYCINCDRITIKDLTFTNNFVGIGFRNTNNSSIENNSISENIVSIAFNQSSNNSIAGNNASNNSEGIFLVNNANSNVIKGNKVSNNIFGIDLEGSSANTIVGNIVCNNIEGLFLINYSNSNAIKGNKVSNNFDGIYVENTISNNIYLNNFISNNVNLYSGNSTNIWNSTEKITYFYKRKTYENYLGNHWGNYMGSDSNNDGIDDTPYNIDTDSDNYPLMASFEDFLLVETIFDTGASANPYPSFSGRHEGKIKPSVDIVVSKMYTYPCAGTGGHTKSIKLYENDALKASGNWSGYQHDWQNITITPSVTLKEGREYRYVIETGSYPQIIHVHNYTDAIGGTITCDEFTDANGHTYDNWIPAIRLS